MIDPACPPAVTFTNYRQVVYRQYLGTVLGHISRVGCYSVNTVCQHRTAGASLGDEGQHASQSLVPLSTNDAPFNPAATMLRCRARVLTITLQRSGRSA